MRVEWCCKTGYMDIGPAFRLRLAALARMLQASAVTHSEQVGIRSRDLVANGTAWLLSNLVLSIRRLPTFGEEIRALTWHKGSRGFKALRDFEVLAGEKSLVSVAILWFFSTWRTKGPSASHRPSCKPTPLRRTMRSIAIWTAGGRTRPHAKKRFFRRRCAAVILIPMGM